MTISIVYVYPPAAGAIYHSYAERFLFSYHANSPGTDHETIVVLNSVRASSETVCLFSSLPHLRFIEHDNSGYDIGGFQRAAQECRSDMIVFFGNSTFFFKPGWLLRMATAFQLHGNAQYGAMGNRGDLAVKVWPHIRTTAFWMGPELMNAYPQRVTRPQDRHPFEHGPNCFTEWVKKQGLKSWVITWGKDLLWHDWDTDPNGFHRGNQSALLAGDHICEKPYFQGNRCLSPAMRQRVGPAVPFCVPWQSENCWPCLTEHR